MLRRHCFAARARTGMRFVIFVVGHYGALLQHGPRHHLQPANDYGWLAPYDSCCGSYLSAISAPLVVVFSNVLRGAAGVDGLDSPGLCGLRICPC